MSTSGENIGNENDSTKKRPLEDAANPLASSQDGSDETMAALRKTKVTRKQVSQNHTWRKFDKPTTGDGDDKANNALPHEGSYAHPTQQALFGIDLNQERFVHPEGTQTMKRKVCLFLGYLGTNYSGYQHNAGQRTIQAELELALYKAGLIAEFNMGFPQKQSYSVSARTDKGVHACAQVASIKVELTEPDLDDCLEGVRQRIEDILPADIRVLDLIRTTRNFCAKTQRDRVRYQYMIPSFLLHPDYRGLIETQGIPLTGRLEVAKAPLTSEEIAKLQPIVNAFRSTPEQRTVLATALKKYEGTHPFHNFTKGMKPDQPQAMRFIETFSCQDPVIIRGVEWIPTQVLGQSFLLHQIRKMVCAAVDVTRGAASMEILERALTKDDLTRIALAPAQGLFLEMSYFGGYNRRKNFQNKNDLPDLDWTKVGPGHDRWKQFRNTIREHITGEEVEQRNFIQYLYQQECIFEYKKFYKLDGKNGSVDVA